MQRSYLLLIFLITHFPVFSQLNESFSDSNFTSNPSWSGETSYFFINNALQLQSNGPNAASQLHLSLPNKRCRDTEWTFYILQDFDITTSNYSRIYLTSDREDTENNPKGYYVKFDGTSNSVDLYRQDSMTHTKIIAGKKDRAGKTSMNIFSVKVICDQLGNWYLFSDSTGTGNLPVMEGSGTDTSFTSSGFAGVYFVHSSTRRNKFYFDDFVIRDAPLALLSATAKGSSSMDLLFSRQVDLNSISNVSNYVFNIPGISVVASSVDQANKRLVHLQLSSVLNTYTNYTIAANNVKDQSGNTISFLNTASFSYRIETGYGDVIMTEIFPDPSPQNSLPEAEYIELFNRNADTLELKNFMLSDGSSNAKFPSFKIAPYQYIIVCSSTNVTLFNMYQTVLGLSGFPSLNNSEDKLTLKNQNGVLLHSVNYFDSWYGDNDKKQGGWSLEMIDVNNPCGEANNWTASVDPSGGTPAKANSVADARPDLLPPKLVSIFIIDSTHIELLFDEKPEADFLLASQFSLNRNNSIVSVKPSATLAEKIIVEVAEKFKVGEQYKLSFYGIRDCNGNSIIQPIEEDIILPQKAVVGDIILNEVLFNPQSGGVDFVELYNNSDKYIDVRKWHFANTKEGIIANKEIISEEPFILKPHDYAAFTEDKDILFNNYPFSNHKKVFQVKDLPSYNDDEGTVILLDSNFIVMDRFDYTEDMHYALIDDKEGVSLERISFGEATNDVQNWQSASSQSGYATPGYKNSQSMNSPKGTDVWIEPKIITPDGNGDKDFAMINYKFNSSGNTANITIFDHQGREMLRLAQNELLSTEGFYQWDGNNAQNEKVRVGAYVVYFEMFNLKGEVEKYRETVVVGWSE